LTANVGIHRGPYEPRVWHCCSQIEETKELTQATLEAEKSGLLETQDRSKMLPK
jgi:hypothetical protein